MTPRDGDLRVISFRKANQREARHYAKKYERASRPDDDNPEWTADACARAQPASVVLPQFIGEAAAQELMGRGRGRPPKADKKVNQTLRLDADVLEAYRLQGRGWQTRINRVLREHMHDERE